MRVLVTGGRNYKNREAVYRVLDSLEITLLIQGGAPGADRLAYNWAIVNRVNFVTCHADWRKYGKAAGPMRNKEMIDNYKPDLVVAFPGGVGTENCKKIAKEAGIKVIEAVDIMRELG